MTTSCAYLHFLHVRIELKLTPRLIALPPALPPDSVRASVAIHNMLADHILRLPKSFFDTNPTGKRCSKGGQRVWC